LANFKAEQVMKDALNEREAKAEALVREGKMPPVIYEKLFANFNSDNEKIAAFSQVANANGVSLEAELHSIDKVLDVFDEMPELGVFTAYSNNYASEEEISEELALQEEAQRRLQLRKQRKGGLV
jgi:nickel-dependent lactate racemase